MSITTGTITATVKIGDKARITGNDNSPVHYLDIGSEAEVVDVPSDDGFGSSPRLRGQSSLFGETTTQFVNPADFEVITNPAFKFQVGIDAINSIDITPRYDIEYDVAIDLLVAAAVAKPDHVDPSGAKGLTCQYVYDNGDRCIVGQVFHYYGVDDSRMEKETGSVSGLLRVLDVNPDDYARIVLGHAQSRQDNGARWIDAVRSALHEVLRAALGHDAVGPNPYDSTDVAAAKRNAADVIAYADAALVKLDLFADALGLDERRWIDA